MLCGLGLWLSSPPSWSNRQRDAVDSVGVAPHCRPGVQGRACGLLLAIRGTSAREFRPPRLAIDFATTLNVKLHHHEAPAADLGNPAAPVPAHSR